MTWWAWTLLWIVLVVAALGVFFLVGRSLWRKGTALLTELGTASDRLASVADELDTLNATAVRAEELAVFASPSTLRQQRIMTRRARTRVAGRRSTRPDAAV